MRPRTSGCGGRGGTGRTSLERSRPAPSSPRVWSRRTRSAPGRSGAALSRGRRRGLGREPRARPGVDPPRDGVGGARRRTPADLAVGSRRSCVPLGAGRDVPTPHVARLGSSGGRVGSLWAMAPLAIRGGLRSRGGRRSAVARRSAGVRGQAGVGDAPGVGAGCRLPGGVLRGRAGRVGPSAPSGSPPSAKNDTPGLLLDHGASSASGPAKGRRRTRDLESSCTRLGEACHDATGSAADRAHPPWCRRPGVVRRSDRSGRRGRRGAKGRVGVRRALQPSPPTPGLRGVATWTGSSIRGGEGPPTRASVVALDGESRRLFGGRRRRVLRGAGRMSAERPGCAVVGSGNGRERGLA